MRVFIAAGIVFDTDYIQQNAVRLVIDQRRTWTQQFRDARDASDFSSMVRAELVMENCAEWLRHNLARLGGDPKAIERFLAEDRRYILEREERCTWCWYGTGDPPEGLRDPVSSNRWPKNYVLKEYRRPGGRTGLATLSPKLVVED